MPLEIDSELLPTEGDIAFYEEHGWFASSVILSPEQLEDANYGAERFYSGERDRKLPIRLGYLHWSPEDGDVLRQNDYVSLQNDEISDLVATPVLSAIAGSLARTESIRLFHDQLIYKPPTAEPTTTVGWHSDRAYWKTCTSENMLTAWVPFAATTAEGGTLMFLDGSHKWPRVEELSTFGEQNHESVEELYASLGYPIKRIAMELRPGQVSFHHCRLIHGSQPNSADVPRLALAVHFQDSTNRYTPATNAEGHEVVHINDVLCRQGADGLPDYGDSDVCPLLWVAQSETTTEGQR